MNELTNIVTIRHYKDGSIRVSINGRDLQDVTSVNYDQDRKLAFINLKVAQFNEHDGDRHPSLPPLSDTLIARFGRWLSRRII